MAPTCTVLITSAGRRVGLMACFRKEAVTLGLSMQLLAVDRDPAWSAACHQADKTFSVPPCTDPAYVDTLLHLCHTHDVQLVIPTIDTELIVLAKAAPRFDAIGTRVVVSSPDAVQCFRDKYATVRWLEQHGIPTPRTYHWQDFKVEPTMLRWPVVVKPRAGSSSIGIHRLYHPAMCAGLDLPDDYIAQELWEGREFTVNIFADVQGTLQSVVAHERVEVRAGEVSKGITRRMPQLEEAAQQLVANMPGLQGPLCFQAIVCADDTFAIFEVNARFGGGYPLAHEAGTPFTRWLLEEGQGIDPTYIPYGRAGVQMLRYDAAIFDTLPC